MNETNFQKLLASLEGLNEKQLEAISKLADKGRGISDTFKWQIKWVLDKFNTCELVACGADAKPYETISFQENTTLDTGIEMLWKLVGGITEGGVTDFGNENARIFVGSSTTAESPTQTGVIAALGSAGMNSGYPMVQGRSITFEASFGSGVAEGNWRESSVANGSGAGAVSLNRKVEDMGTKAANTTWNLRVTIAAATN